MGEDEAGRDERRVEQTEQSLHLFSGGREEGGGKCVEHDQVRRMPWTRLWMTIGPMFPFMLTLMVPPLRGLPKGGTEFSPDAHASGAVARAVATNRDAFGVANGMGRLLGNFATACGPGSSW